MKIIEMAANQIVDMILNRQVKAVDVVEQVLNHVSSVDGDKGRWEKTTNDIDDDKIHAFITVTAEKALEKAYVIDKKIEKGENPGPLCGVPFTAKDIFTVKGTPQQQVREFLPILLHLTLPHQLSAWKTPARY
jgi:aspartyl-tRNA(Asn)/glutamyl-tRNA(Gln) amidotransferase subunit A